MIRVTPKTTERPTETRNRIAAELSPVRTCAMNCPMATSSPSPGSTHRQTALVLGPHAPHLVIRRQIVRAVVIGEVDHSALVVLQRNLADIHAHRGLMVNLTESDLTQRAFHR